MNRKTFTRRTFLRSTAGVTLALPFLESMAEAATPQAKRLLIFFTPNGVNMKDDGSVDTFRPVTPFGALTADSWAGQATSPLGAWHQKILIPSNLMQSPGGQWFGDRQTGSIEAGDHGCDTFSKLTCAKGIAGPGSNVINRANGISLDQFAASKINVPGRSALVLGVQATRTDSVGYVSYSAPGQPVTPIANPWKAYTDMVAATPAVVGMVDRTVLRRQSVLDLLAGELSSLKTRALSSADVTRLDQHYTAIRDFEQQAQQAGLVACRVAAPLQTEINGFAPGGMSLSNPSNFPTIGRLQMEVMALALACDYTRVGLIQWASGADGPRFNWINGNHTYSHHPLSHHSATDGGDGDLGEAFSRARMYEIDNWYTQQYVAMLSKLDAYTDTNGTLLDNSVVLWVNEMSDGRAHSGFRLPFVLAGSAGGYLKQGRYVEITEKQFGDGRWDDGAPHNKLYTTVLNGLGIPIDMFGQSGNSGEYSALKA